MAKKKKLAKAERKEARLLEMLWVGLDLHVRQILKKDGF